MNVLLVCVILFALWRGYAGMKKGLVDEIRMLLSLVISLFVLSLAILLYSSVKEKNNTNIILSILMLLITGLAARLVNLIFKSLSAIAHLPIPFLRGVFNFIDSLVLGMSTLTWSAQFFEEDEPEKNIADQKKKAKKPEQKEMVSDAVTENVDGKADATDTKEKKSGAAESIAVGGTVALSILMAVAIFIVLPYFLSMLFSHYVLNESLLAIVEGVLRIVIFVAYIAGISAMKDIRRVYMYHGAEHKCINCIERGRELTVKNVRKSSRLHKRCGTSFLLFVMLVSIVLFLFIRVQNPLLRLGLRILLIPVIAGISYELIRLAGRSDNFLVRIISAPGMWLQRLTTKEPDDSMIEVAIASVEAVFDWKAYLKETFGYDVEDWEKQDAAAKAQEAEDAEAAEGMEAGKVAAEESREQ